jgi:hypothetical protein
MIKEAANRTAPDSHRFMPQVIVDHRISAPILGMSRYFFDTRDGTFVKDEDGTECVSIDEAMNEASCLLAEIAHNRERGELEPVTVEVNDEAHQPLFIMKLTVDLAHSPK